MTAKRFEGVVNEDIRDSEPDWGPYEQPKAPARYTTRDESGLTATMPGGKRKRRGKG